MKSEISLKDTSTKTLTSNFIVDKSNMIDIIMETLIRKSTIKRWFPITNYCYVYLNKEGHLVSHIFNPTIISITLMSKYIPLPRMCT